MRPSLLVLFLLTGSLLHIPLSSQAALQKGSTPSKVATMEAPSPGLTAEDMLSTHYGAWRKKTGLKLNFFQRMGLRAAQRQYKRMAKREQAFNPRQRAANPNKLGLIGLILGAAGIVFLFIPYVAVLSFFLAIAAIVVGAIGLSKDEKPGLAIGAIVLGGLTLLLVAVALVVVAASFGA